MNRQQAQQEQEEKWLASNVDLHEVPVQEEDLLRCDAGSMGQTSRQMVWMRRLQSISIKISQIIKIIAIATLLFLLTWIVYNNNKQNIQLQQRLQLSRNDIRKYESINYWMRYSLERISNQSLSSSLTNKTPRQLPNILWLYTQFAFQAEKMLEEVFGNNLVLRAQQAGFDVKVVDSQSAYQWLSPETKDIVTNTMQNLRIEQSINDVLRLALLKDNGGVVVKVAETILVEGMSWIKELFGSSNHQVLLFAERNATGAVVYQDFIVATHKGSRLIQDTFNSLCKAISTGRLQFWLLEQAAYKNQVMNSTRVFDLAENIMNAWLQIMGSHYYKTKVVEVDITKFSEPVCQQNLIALLKVQKQRYDEICGQTKFALHLSEKIFRSRLQDELEKAIQKQSLDAQAGSYWHDLMTVPKNKKLYQPLPSRSIHYCLLDANPTDHLQSIRQSVQALKQQTFKPWKAVYFIVKMSPQAQSFIAQQSQLGFNISLVPKTQSLGNNYEIGIIKFCPNKSFVVILKKQERLSEPTSLQNLVHTIAPRQVLGAFVGLNISGKVSMPISSYEGYNKIDYNGAYPRQKDLNAILNHLRVFHSDCFKIIPQFSLRTTEGIYFNDRFIFLQIFINTVQNASGLHDLTQIPHTQRVKWFIKKSSQVFDVPFKISLHGLTINTDTWDRVDRNQLKINRFKIEAFPMTYNMDHLLQNGQTMRQFAIFNPANDYQPYTKRNRPQLIPKIIHQIWIGGQMPQAKRIVIEQNMKFYPDFELKIWSKANITRENFPLSYDLLQTLDEVETFTRFSRRATMADVMRHQILYREGGFYMDTSMMLFGDIFYKWLSYKAVLAAERTFRHRWSQSMCFFAVMPQFPGLLRIISHINTNKYNIYLRDAVMIAGPNDFRRFIQGSEEYDPDILLMQYSTFYPFTYDFFSFFDCYCAIEPKFLTRQDKYLLKVGSKVIIRGCGKYYPHSFGKELNAIGSSWQNPKN